MVIRLLFAAILVAFRFGFYKENARVLAQKTGYENPAVFPSDSLRFYAEKFNRMNTLIRDGRLDQARAQKEMSYLFPAIKRYYFLQKNTGSASKKQFPVQGYSARAIGGTNGSGYLPKGYNYYHGNQHTGHPAHDIFIQDKNLDSRDDKTGKPVKIVALSNGLVVAAEPAWSPDSPLRGGVYVWVYDPGEELLFYYAHNQALLVKPGDLVKAGQEIGTLGRTGLNAAKKRSPTHLHFMALKVTPAADLRPVNIYEILRQF